MELYAGLDLHPISLHSRIKRIILLNKILLNYRCLSLFIKIIFLQQIPVCIDFDDRKLLANRPGKLSLFTIFPFQS